MRALSVTQWTVTWPSSSGPLPSVPTHPLLSIFHPSHFQMWHTRLLLILSSALLAITGNCAFLNTLLTLRCPPKLCPFVSPHPLSPVPPTTATSLAASAFAEEWLERSHQVPGLGWAMMTRCQVWCCHSCHGRQLPVPTSFPPVKRQVIGS